MHVTASTIPLCLLTVYLWHRAKGEWLPVMMFLSIFQAASVLNLGSSVGIQPTYLALLLALIKKIPERLNPSRFGPFPKPWAMLVLIAFVAYSVVSSFVNPIAFAGVPITNPKLGNDVSLYWETGHLNQLLYLLLSFTLYVVAAYKSSPSELSRSVDWYVAGCVAAALIAIYQFVSLRVGLPFPSQIFDSSPNYAIFPVYDIGNFTRVNSTFTEAAAAASSMTVGLAIVVWRMVSFHLTTHNIISSLLILTAVILTLSTTGYVCLAFLGGVFLVRYVSQWKGSTQFRLAKALLILPVTSLVLLCAIAEGPKHYLMGLADTVVVSKKDTESYKARSEANESAVRTALRTNWLGAGFGVCRASSLIPTLLGNVGLPGFSLFIVFVTYLFLPKTRIAHAPTLERRATLFALAGYLLNSVLSGPEVTNPVLWFFFAMAAKYANGWRAVTPGREALKLSSSRRLATRFPLHS